MKLKQPLEIPEIDIQDVLAKLSNVKKTANGWTARCPSHDDNRNSLSVSEKDGKLLVHCFACKVPYEAFLKEIGLWAEPTPKTPVKSKIVETYDYTDEEGELLYQVVRYEPKNFKQRRPDANGGWAYDLKGVVRVLYRLPYIIDAETVFIVEGEKDADLLVSFGLEATTNSGGAGKWSKEYNKYLKGKDVIIIPDNDEAGRLHAEEVSKSIYLSAQSVKILDLNIGNAKGDISDWLDENSVEDLLSLVNFTEPIEYTDEDLNFDSTLPKSEESEAFVLGAMIKDPTLLPKFLLNGSVNFFYLPKHQKIIKVMVELHENNVGVDIITLSDKLKQKKLLDKIGGTTYLQSLRDITSDTSNFFHWIKVLESKSNLRALLRVTDKANKVASLEADDAENLRQNIAEELNKLRPKSNKISFTKIGAVSEEVVSFARDLTGDLVGLGTGFVDLDEATSGLQKTDLIILAGRPAMGKALSNDYPVLTSKGWTTMGKIKVGDTVIGSNGLPTMVTGVFPQGLKPMYEITFHDGIKSESCDEHLWFVQSRQDRKAKRKGSVLSLSEIAKNLRTKDGKRKNYCVPYIEPVEFVEQNNELNPYLLGALIGDGGLSGRTVKFTNKDVDVISMVKETLPSSDKIKNFKGGIDYKISRKIRNNKKSTTKEIIDSLGLNVKSDKKFIPKSYIYTSKKDRIELLRGLLDTDGYISKSGWIEYSTVSERLAHDVKEVVLSLGGRCTIKSRSTSYTYKGEKKLGKPSFRVRITFPSKQFNPFYCKRKASRFDLSNSRRKNGRYIVSVDFVGEKEATCIKVSAKDELFVIKDYILTHNTALSLNIATNVAMNGHNVLFFSLEMSKEQLTQRIIGSQARVSVKGLRNGNLDPSSWSRIATILPEIQNLNLDICDYGGLTIGQVNSVIREYSEVNNKYPDFVVIDYIQLMSGSRTENRQQEVSQISRELKSMAKEYKIPVLALSQLSRAPESRANARPLMSDLRESGSLEQDADVVAFVYREEYYNPSEDHEGLAECILAKQRNGEAKTIHLAYTGKFTRFDNIFSSTPNIKLD